MIRYPGLRDRVVLITGAGGGLGRTLAEAFLAQGSRLALVDIDDPALTSVVEALGQDADRVRGEVVDLAVTGSCEPLVERFAEAFGSLDVLVNNAAVISRMPLDAVTAEEFERVLRVDLLAPFFLARAAIDRMRVAGRGGRIINVASMAARTGGTSDVYMYAASKGGLLAVTRLPGQGRRLRRHPHQCHPAVEHRQPDAPRSVPARLGATHAGGCPRRSRGGAHGGRRARPLAGQ